MAICEVGSEAVQNLGEREPFLRQPPGKRSLTYPQFVGNLAGVCLAVWQLRSNDSPR